MNNGIKGLTDNWDDPGYSIFGYICKGAEKPESGPGRDLDHFRLSCQDENVLEVFNHHYGSTPRAINGYLPYESISDCFHSTMQQIKGKTIWKQCNREEIYRWRTPEGKYSEKPKPCIWTPDKFKCPDCKPSMKIHILCKELLEAGYIGVLVAQSTAYNDARRLTDNLSQLVKLSRITGVPITSIPIVLQRFTTKVRRRMDDGSYTRPRKSLLAIAPHQDWLQQYIGGAFGRTNPTIATAAQTLAQSFTIPPEDSEEEEEDEDWSDMVQEMNFLIEQRVEELGWDTETAKRELEKITGKRSRQLLDKDQLLAFLNHLDVLQYAQRQPIKHDYHDVLS